MSWLLTIGGICLLIVLHELGHFAAAKAVGMRVERFSLFFPPKLLGVTRGETEYSVGALPLGGYVKISGMTPEEVPPSLRDAPALRGATRARVQEGPHGDLQVLTLTGADRWDDVSALLTPAQLAAAREDVGRAYVNQPPWKRVVVIAAGPAVNLAIAFVIFAAVLGSGDLGGAFRLETLTPAVATTKAINSVDAVETNEPATGVLRPGDRIVAVDGRPGTPATIAAAVGRHVCAGAPTAGCRGATPVALTVERAGRPVSISLYPQYDAAAKRMRLGFAFGEAARHFGPAAATGASLREMWAITKQTISGLGTALTSSKARHQISSIVGIAQATNQNVGFGAGYALVVLGFVSLALAVINLFPFLPLDGGHILWAVAEKLRGRRIPATVMWQLSSVGIVLLLFLVVNGLSNDISRLTGS